MDSRRWKFIFIVVFALALTVLACGSIPSIPSIPDIALPADEAEQDTGSTTTGEDEVPLDYTGIDLSGLSSYRSQFSMTFEGTDDSGQPVSGSYTFQESMSTDPQAYFFHWEGQGFGDTMGGGGYELTQIGETSYMVTDDGSGNPSCITFSEEGSTAGDSQVLSPDSFLSGADLSNAKRIRPDEQVNGVMTRHYQITEAEATLAGFSNYIVDIWIAVDGGYIIRETLVADGTLISLGSGSGHFEWTYDLLDINGPVDIQPPANCEAPAGSDFPKMPDATEVASMGTMLTYSTASPVADVVAFYRAELPALGWTEVTYAEYSGMAMIDFARGEEHVSITISESDGKITVLIMFS